MDINYYKQYEPIFGAWRIERQIGEGSFGKVFEIVREDFGVTYRAALKAITVPASEAELLDVKADGMDDRSVRAYFGGFVEELVKEFALMSRLKGNSNIVSYENHKVIEHKNGIGWDILIQMELLTPLNRYTADHAVTAKDVIRLGADLCRALELCQTYHIIHRDVKPENIFISETGSFKLGDFGIARTVEKTTSGLSKKGTYTYMAPEVYKGEPYGATVDIYSLGIVLYRLLNGSRTPFLPAAPAPVTHNDRENALARRLSGAPLPPPRFASGPLAAIVLKACAYDPRARYQSPAQMRADLEKLLLQSGNNAVLDRGEGFTDRGSGSSGGQPPLPVIDPTQKDPPQGGGIPPQGGRRGPAHAQNPDGTVSDFPDRHPQGGGVPPQGGGRGPAHAQNPDGTVSDFPDRHPQGGGIPPQGGRRGPAPEQNPDGTVSDFPNRPPQGGGIPPQGGGTPPAKPAAQKKFPGWAIGLLVGAGVVIFAIFGLFVSSLGNTPAADVTSRTGTASSSASVSVSEETENAMYGVPTSIEIGDYLETEYDGEGKVIGQPSFEFDGSVSRNVRAYGDDGKVKYIAAYNLLGELESFTLYTRELTNTRIETFDRFGELERFNIEYYEDGVRTRTDYLDANGDLTSYTYYRYNDDGNLARSVSYNPDGSFSSGTEYAYDGDNIAAYYYYNETGILLAYSRYERDEDGTVISDSSYDADGVPTTRTDYDSLSRTVKELVYEETGAVQSQNEYFYDDDGFRTRLEQTGADGSLERYTEYEHGESGNISAVREYAADGTLQYEAEKDKWGNFLMSAYYDEAGAITSKTENAYDEKGRRASETSYGAGGVLNYVREYNEEGLAVKFAWYDEGSLLYTVTTEYDENGNAVKESVFEPNGSLRDYTLTVYGDGGTVTQKREYRSNNTLSLTTDYNEDGLVFKLTNYGEEGELTDWAEYAYDEAGNEVETTRYLADGSLKSRETSEYNENGQLIRVNQYNESNVLESYEEYEYDAAGNRTRYNNFRGDGTLSGYYLYEYNEQGKKTKTSAYDENGELTWYDITEYDEDGTYLRTTTYDADGTPW